MRGQASARLFVAVDPPEEVREQLAAWARTALRAAGASRGEGHPLRVLDAELLHLTLCFLGNRPVAEIDRIAAQVAAVARPLGELSVGAPLWLPPRHPRVLAVELHDDSGELALLHSSLIASLSEVCDLDEGAGKVARHHRFRPHITLARMRHGAAPRDRTLAPTPALSFVPRELVLYRSWLSDSGASYEPLSSNLIG